MFGQFVRPQSECAIVEVCGKTSDVLLEELDKLMYDGWMLAVATQGKIFLSRPTIEYIEQVLMKTNPDIVMPQWSKGV